MNRPQSTPSLSPEPEGDAPPHRRAPPSCDLGRAPPNCFLRRAPPSRPPWHNRSPHQSARHRRLPPSQGRAPRDHRHPHPAEPSRSAPGGRSGPRRRRRRTSLRLPLRTGRLPHPAAPGRRRHPAHRSGHRRAPDRAGHSPRRTRVDPPCRRPGHPLPDRTRPEGRFPVRHRAGGPPPGPAARRARRRHRGDPGPAPGQGPRGRRLVHPAPARLLAHLRRPRRRAAH